MSQTSKQVTGRLGEDLAADFLEKNGYRIVARNIHVSRNEIDIIAEDDAFTVFVEVKTRSCRFPESSDFGVPGRAVDGEKRKNTVKAAREYIYRHGCEKQPRIDVIEVFLAETDAKFPTPTPLKINHIRDAFDARGRRR